MKLSASRSSQWGLAGRPAIARHRPSVQIFYGTLNATSNRSKPAARLGTELRAPQPDHQQQLEHRVSRQRGPGLRRQGFFPDRECRQPRRRNHLGILGVGAILESGSRAAGDSSPSVSGTRLTSTRPSASTRSTIRASAPTRILGGTGHQHGRPGRCDFAQRASFDRRVSNVVGSWNRSLT